MKSLVRLFLLVLVSASVAQADLVVVQRVEGSGQSGEMTMKIKDGRARIDISPQVSTIVDGKTGEATTLMHNEKTYLRIPAQAAKQLMQRMQQIQKEQTPENAPVGSPKLTPTGKKETISGYETEEFTASSGAANMSYWIARDFPNYQSILQQIQAAQEGTMAQIGQDLMPDPNEFPGLPIRTVVEMGGQRVTTTMVSVREQELDPAEVQVPTDYKEMKMPSFNFGGEQS